MRKVEEIKGVIRKRILQRKIDKLIEGQEELKKEIHILRLENKLLQEGTNGTRKSNVNS